MGLLLGIDLGTSYFKLGLFDTDLRLRGLGRQPVPVAGPPPRQEVAVDAFWRTLRRGLDEALAAAGALAGDIGALSWSSQANSFLLLDGADTPLTPFLLWTDSRQPVLPEALRQLNRHPDFLATTGIGTGVGTASAVAKLAWFQRESPACWSRAARVLTLADYLAWSLTGRRRGDAGTASLLGLMDQRSLAWWPEALAAAGLREDQLATPLRPGTPIGPVTPEGAARLGLTAGIPVVAGSLDHHAAALGAGLGERAPVCESTGTVLACVAMCDRYQPREGLCTLPGVEPGTWAQLAFDGNGAGVLEWYRRTFAPETSFKELDRLAAAVPPDCDGLAARPLPHLQPGLDGFVNRRASHGHGHYARAIMTATADTLGVLLDRLCPGARPRRVVATGGGAHSPFWLQLKRERLGLDIFPADCPEPACRGAALLAARACRHMGPEKQ